MAEVNLKNVSKTYNRNIYAINNINLKVKDKEFLVLLGPSGCGKTTTLRVIAGLEEPTDGYIYIGERLVNNIPPKDRNIAMVFQNYALYPHMSVYENMAFCLKLRGYSNSYIKEKVEETAKILGISHLLERKPKDLSGGERQRVALGKAIVRKPLVFLFDEPLSNLDPKMRIHMRAEIHKIHLKIQSTMIYVTHDQTEAMTLGERIAVMKDGNILQCDAPLNIYNHPVNKFVAGFIGSPPMNFLKGKIIKKDNKFYFEGGIFRLKILDETREYLVNYVNREIILGIRPEDIYDKIFASYSTPDNTLTGICEVVETLGQVNYFYFSIGENTLVAITEASNKPSVGSILEVVFDMKKVHFFDPYTEKALV